jgi:hypothetical protein
MTQKETYETVSEWAVNTFGSVGSNDRVLARAMEEGAEFYRAVTSDQPIDKQVEEAADIAIVLCRICIRLGITPQIPSFRTPDVRLDSLQHAAAAVAALGKLLNASATQDLTEVNVHLRETYRQLAFFALSAKNVWLWDEVTAKMVINRKRVWKRDSTGCGYHVRDA